MMGCLSFWGESMLIPLWLTRQSYHGLLHRLIQSFFEHHDEVDRLHQNGARTNWFSNKQTPASKSGGGTGPGSTLQVGGERVPETSATS